MSNGWSMDRCEVSHISPPSCRFHLTLPSLYLSLRSSLSSLSSSASRLLFSKSSVNILGFLDTMAGKSPGLSKSKCHQTMPARYILPISPLGSDQKLCEPQFLGISWLMFAKLMNSSSRVKQQKGRLPTTCCDHRTWRLIHIH